MNILVHSCAYSEGEAATKTKNKSSWQKNFRLTCLLNFQMCCCWQGAYLFNLNKTEFEKFLENTSKRNFRIFFFRQVRFPFPTESCMRQTNME